MSDKLRTACSKGQTVASLVASQDHIANAAVNVKADYVAADVDTAAEMAAVANTNAAAINAAAVKFNTLLAELETAGILKTS